MCADEYILPRKIHCSIGLRRPQMFSTCQSNTHDHIRYCSRVACNPGRNRIFCITLHPGLLLWASVYSKPRKMTVVLSHFLFTVTLWMIQIKLSDLGKSGILPYAPCITKETIAFGYFEQDTYVYIRWPQQFICVQNCVQTPLSCTLSDSLSNSGVQDRKFRHQSTSGWTNMSQTCRSQNIMCKEWGLHTSNTPSFTRNTILLWMNL